jgi:alginate O-acetyltransferase complex protein AlgI
MLFCSQKFILFFLAVFALYWSLPWQRVRIYLLLVASFVFYASWDPRLALLITATTVADYLIGRGLDAAQNPRLRKSLMLFSLVMNLGVLGTFKYFNFFLGSLEASLAASGVSTSWAGLDLILPIGISFYTFEAISYTVDIYQRRIPAERNLAHFMLFILFFPHLIAGPIVRGRDFLPQVRRRKRFNWVRMHVGLQYFLMGMFKKLAIADRMAVFADPVFSDPGNYATQTVWLAVLAYAVQIYCDFSGYSDMALGTAHMLGYRLTLNFDMPYLARNVSELWRRWHMSLSTWLRDYLFIPLGGSRGTRWQTCRNLLITMALGGLWHGAAWTFVVWGLLHGSYLCIHRTFKEHCGPKLRWLLATPPGHLACIALTFFSFNLALVFFRAPTFSGAWQMLGRMFVPTAGMGTPLPKQSLYVLFGLVIACHLLGQNDRWKKLLEAIPAPARGLAYAGATCAALVLAPDSGRAFIYFQF